MPDKALDAVEWELVRADIAMEKARLKANGDWATWEKFQAHSNAMLSAYAAPAEWMRTAMTQPPMTEEERAALWLAVRTPELPGLMGPPRRPRRPGWPLRWARRTSY
jgi:hypothetical protein